MTNSSSVDKRKNKNFLINNKYELRNYALKNREIFGQGIVVINLLLIKTDVVDDSQLFNLDPDEQEEPTIHQPISYIPRKNFWFKMLNLKIKKKYQIDLQEDNEKSNKFLVVFVKDASIEHFSIYSLKLDSDNKVSNT